MNVSIFHISRIIKNFVNEIYTIYFFYFQSRVHDYITCYVGWMVARLMTQSGGGIDIHQGCLKTGSKSFKNHPVKLNPTPTGQQISSIIAVFLLEQIKEKKREFTSAIGSILLKAGPL